MVWQVKDRTGNVPPFRPASYVYFQYNNYIYGKTSKMERKIDQLLQEIEAAKQRKPEEPLARIDPDLPEVLFGADEFIKAPMKTFSELTGISPGQLPPPDQLSTAQQIQLGQAIIELWRIFNILAEFPDTVPDEAYYSILRKCWTAEEVQVLGLTHLHYDFCTGYAPDCILGEYCPCKKYW